MSNFWTHFKWILVEFPSEDKFKPSFFRRCFVSFMVEAIVIGNPLNVLSLRNWRFKKVLLFL